MGLCFTFLTIGADEYLSPSCQQISRTFKLSSSISGVTMLAFGGSAPDLFSSLAASEGSSTEGIHMGIAVLCGSALFMIGFITCLVIQAAPTDEFPLNRDFLLRDSLFLLLAQLLLLGAIIFKGSLSLQMGYLFVALYGVYVLVVIGQDRWYT